MPGKRITDHQLHQYKKDRNQMTQVAAAARAGLSERSARRIEQSESLPSQREPRAWRTRTDPLSEVWDAENAEQSVRSRVLLACCSRPSGICRGRFIATAIDELIEIPSSAAGLAAAD